MLFVLFFGKLGPMANTDEKIEKMFKAGIHFGYSRSSRYPKMKDFLFGLKNNVEIFDLEKTNEMLDRAKEFMFVLGKEKKQFILVGTKTETKGIMEKFAKEANMPYVIERWLGGTLTNFKAIRGRISHMKDLEQKKDKKELEKYTKKEQIEIERKIIRLKNYLGGLVDMENLPSAILVVDSKKEKNAVKEANDMKVPVVAVINTDCDPKTADYPIPANDNSKTSVEFLLNELIGAYKEGVKEYKEKEIEK